MQKWSVPSKVLASATAVWAATSISLEVSAFAKAAEIANTPRAALKRQAMEKNRDDLSLMRFGSMCAMSVTAFAAMFSISRDKYRTGVEELAGKQS